MAPHFSPGSGCLSAREDVDLQLLHDTQTYLKCRFRRQAHARVGVESWERFYRICDPLLHRYACAFHVPRADLTDFLQEVWTELVKTLRDFPYDRQRGRFSSWLYRVVHCKAIDWLRRRTRHPTRSCTSPAAPERFTTDTASQSASRTSPASTPIRLPPISRRARWGRGSGG